MQHPKLLLHAAHTLWKDEKYLGIGQVAADQWS